MRSDRERLLDIQDAIAKIEQYANQGREVFENDELIQVWILHHLQILGEAASNAPPALKLVRYAVANSTLLTHLKIKRSPN